MKKFLNFIIGKLFKKKIPLANLDNCYPPVICEETSLNVETLAFECFIEHGLVVPESIYKREIATGLGKQLIPYIKFEANEDNIYGGIRYRGVIRIVKEGN